MNSDDATDQSSDLSELDSALFVQPDEPTDEATASESPTSSKAHTPLLRQRPPRGKRRRALDTWAHARERHPWEDEKNQHKQKVFYCRYCSWAGTISNAPHHLRTHSVRVDNSFDSVKKQAARNVLQASFSH